MVSRKKAAGKARKAAKAKAREVQAKAKEEEERKIGQNLVDQFEQLSCKHGTDSFCSSDICIRFVIAFSNAYGKAIKGCDRGDGNDIGIGCLVDAHVATMEKEEDEFVEMWKDSTKIEIAASCFFCIGVEAMIEGKYDDARLAAAVAVYFEQTIAVSLKQSQAEPDYQKIREVSEADLPALKTFFRSRIPCSCLDDEIDTTNANEVKLGLNQEQTLTVRQQRPIDKAMQLPCKHGVDDLSLQGVPFLFLAAFRDSFRSTKGGNYSLADRLKGAEASTLDEFADVWGDTTKMEIAISCSLFAGTQFILIGKDDHARCAATLTRYLQQHVAVRLKQTQALFHLPKILEANSADDHSLAKFFRRRIPCSCLDRKYDEVEHITKIGLCFNPQCKLPMRMTARSNTKYCSRCRYATYCSRECQLEDWTEHKPKCDKLAAMIAEFEAKKLKMSIEPVPQS